MSIFHRTNLPFSPQTVPELGSYYTTGTSWSAVTATYKEIAQLLRTKTIQVSATATVLLNEASSTFTSTGTATASWTWSAALQSDFRCNPLACAVPAMLTATLGGTSPVNAPTDFNVTYTYPGQFNEDGSPVPDQTDAFVLSTPANGGLGGLSIGRHGGQLYLRLFGELSCNASYDSYDLEAHAYFYTGNTPPVGYPVYDPTNLNMAQSVIGTVAGANVNCVIINTNNPYGSAFGAPGDAGGGGSSCTFTGVTLTVFDTPPGP